MIEKGNTFQYPEMAFSEKEIIEFAERFDPLDFHINKAAAEKSFFKALIASGPQLFIENYRQFWIPQFGKSVICGLEMNRWRYLKPVYTNMLTYAKVHIANITHTHREGIFVVTWQWEFFNANTHEMIQEIEMKIMHQI
jgi:acyl dehydratase